MEKRPHLEPGKCPGESYFARKEQDNNENIRTIMTEVLGDVPKYMRMAGENRVWLWTLSGLFLIEGIVLIILNI